MPQERLIFDDRIDAGRQLAKALPALDAENTLVLALPRGGVPIAAEICDAHQVPLDLLFVRKIGAPNQPELAVGAVTDGTTVQVVVNDEIAKHFGLSPADVEAMGQDLLPEIARRRAAYVPDRVPLPMAGKTIVVVDDGVATGATLRVALMALKEAHITKLIVAMPVAPADLADRLEGLADQVISLTDLAHFGAVGGAYRQFPQVDDETVQAIVDRLIPRPHA